MEMMFMLSVKMPVLKPVSNRSLMFGNVSFGNVPKSPPQWHDVKRLLTLAEQTLDGKKNWERVSVPTSLRSQMEQSFATTLSDGTRFTYSVPETLTPEGLEQAAVSYQRRFTQPSTDHLQPTQNPASPKSALCAELFEEATAVLNQILLLPLICDQLGYSPEKANGLKKQLRQEVSAIRTKLPKSKKP
jgi:hypothetical protein